MAEAAKFGDLWAAMTPAERHAARAEMEAAVIAALPKKFKLLRTPKQLRIAARGQVDRLIEHCKKTA